jgi:hypothetical protein
MRGLTYLGLALSCLSFSAAVASFNVSAKEARRDQVEARTERAAMRQELAAIRKALAQVVSDKQHFDYLQDEQRNQKIQLRRQERVIQDVRMRKR